MSVAPSLPVLCVHSTAQQCFQFPEDPKNFHTLLTDGITGLKAIVSVNTLFGDESFAAPYLYRAALAITALCVPAHPTPNANFFDATAVPGHPAAIYARKKQAMHHYTRSIQALHATFPETTAAAFCNHPLQDIFVWFLTRLLLANYDLRLGHLAAWRAHLRAASRILSAFHARFMQRETGRQLAWAFARMALLVELQDCDMAVTGTNIMNPGVASDLSSMVEQSERARDRLLVLIRRIGRIELKYRYRLQEAPKWLAKLQQVDCALSRWQTSLPPSELPVDTGIQDSVSFAVRPNLAGKAQRVDIQPLTFPNAADTHAAAVSYAHFLCARMRARTAYRPDGTKDPPRDTEATVLHICRIAAGLSPEICARSEAFGHGILPAIAGAYYWTTNSSMRNWIWQWLGVYEIMGAREGIWNVQQTRRLMVFLDEEAARRRTAQSTWEIVCARIDENEDLVDEDNGVHECAIRREERLMLEDVSSSADGVLVARRCDPFTVTLHSNSACGWSTETLTVS
ncbi:MAG: hypothetical protein STHCBS139747_003401 [Sporothrix thermara]